MKKYHLTESEVVSEEVSYHDIRLCYPWEQQLLWQIGYMVLNSKESYTRKGPSNRPRKLVLFYCTDAQAADTRAELEAARAKAQKEVGSDVTLVPKSWCRFRSTEAVDNE